MWCSHAMSPSLNKGRDFCTAIWELTCTVDVDWQTSHLGPRSHGFPRVPRKTMGPFHYTLVMPVYHFLLLISNVPQLRKRGTLGRLFFNVPHFLRKTWDIGSTVFQCPPLFAPMSHVLWNYPGKCPVLLLRVKPAKPGYNAYCVIFYLSALSPDMSKITYWVNRLKERFCHVEQMTPGG